MPYATMTRDRKKSSSSANYMGLLDGSYRPESEVLKQLLDPVSLLGGVTTEKAKELYNMGSSKPGLYAPAPSDFGTDRVTRATRYKRQIDNVIDNGCY